MTTTPDLEEWSARIPRRLITFVLPILTIAAVAVSITIEGSTGLTGERMQSLPHAALGLAQGALMTAGLLAVGWPHRAPAWVAAGSVVYVATTPYPDERPVFAVLAVVAALLTTLDAVGAGRQRALARGWSPSTAPSVTGTLRRRLVALSPLVVGLWVLCAVGFVAAGAWYLHDKAAVEQFRAASQVADGTVTAVGDGDTTVLTVDIDGRSVHVPEDMSSHSVGDGVRVRYTGGRAELVDDAFDPTGTLLLAGGFLVIADVVGGSALAARTRARRLLEEGGTSVELLAAPVDGGWVQLIDPRTERRITRLRVARWTADGRPAVTKLHEAVAELTAADEADRPDVATLDAAALLAFARERRELEDRFAAAQEAPAVRVLDAPATVTVLGLGAQGDFPLLAEQDGSWLVADRPARDTSWPLLAWRWGAAGRGRVGAPVLDAPSGPERERAAGTPVGPEREWIDEPAAAAVDAGESRTDADVADDLDGADAGRRELPTVMRLAVLTGRWLPWLLVPVLALVARWFAEDEVSFRLVILAVFVTGWGHTWAGLAQDTLRVTPAGVRLRGRFLGDLTPWRRVGAVLHDEETVIVRVVEPDDALIVGVRHPGIPVLGAATTPAEAAAAIERARPAPTDPRARGPRLLPTPATVLAAAWLVAIAAGVLLA